MQGMKWVWLGALLLSMGIVGLMELAGEWEEPQPVVATQETAAPSQTQ